ncbi:MAG: helix-turn-helix transcriptional regulator [Rhodospirillaceae bacterium]|jgi:DNA-binding HxlR family transcriptional regulator|nr:helix-turn-helix transcriptional regulator [Rhodospirillaceae bacterium]MBT5941283.1 helix-turn-helix transcriptional regulator [Rhodospirillaceae bacterium]
MTMTSYGQFCPVSKATEIIGDKWTILILRELLLGTCRFNDLQRSMSRISPTILNKRLKMLEATGVIVKKSQSGKKGYEYRLSGMGKELEPMIDHLAIWGMRWARGQMTKEELDVEFLMWDIRRTIDCKNLPDGETVMSFHFKDIENYGTWWLVCSGGDIDLCTENPGKDVDLYVTTDIRSMIEVWQGDRSLSSALDEELITTVGSAHLMRNMKDWFALCSYKDYRPVELGVNPEEMVP